MMQDHAETVARNKVGGCDKWEIIYWEIVGPDLLVRGGVPRIISKGKRKGQKTWDRPYQIAVVTKLEVEQERKRYEEETGKCADCYGSGQVFKRWTRDNGTEYKTCGTCSGSGKAVLTTSVR